MDTFIAKLGLDEFVNLLEPYEDKSAIAEAAVGFSHGAGCAVRNFTGRTDGMIVEPRHTEFFNGRPIDTGWDPIFIPQVWNLERLTYAQMSFEQRRKMSERSRAISRFVIYLKSERFDQDAAECEVTCSGEQFERANRESNSRGVDRTQKKECGKQRREQNSEFLSANGKGEESTFSNLSPKLVSQTGLPNWSPKLVSKTALPNLSPKLVSQTGLPNWSPKLVSQTGLPNWSPKLVSQSCLPNLSPKLVVR